VKCGETGENKDKMAVKLQYWLLFFGLIALLTPLCVYASIGQSVNEFYHQYTWKTNMMDLWCMTICWNLFLSICYLYKVSMKVLVPSILAVLAFFVAKGSFFHNFDQTKNIVIFAIFISLILIPSITTLQALRLVNENYSELKQTIIDEDHDLEKGKESKDHASFLRLINLGTISPHSSFSFYISFS
jgi:hypothetical protein